MARASSSVATERSHQAVRLAWFRLQQRKRRDPGLKSARDPVEWIEANFHTAVPGGLITLEPVQRAVLRYMFQPPADPADERPFRYRDFHYSTLKKSGKTAVAGAIGQWAASDARVWGRMAEIYCLANDLEQAQGRIYGAIRHSVEQLSDFDMRKGTGRDWRVRDRKMINFRSGSEIVPVSGNYRGSAGGNPTLTLWSELWGYVYEASHRLWDEMKPSPIRPVSVRFVETYRGFRGESDLLEQREKLILQEGRQVLAGELAAVLQEHYGVTDPVDLYPFDEAPTPEAPVPLYTHDVAGLCAYIDEGEQARRMPWQRGEEGRRYYEREALVDRPEDFERHHLNRWAESSSQAIPIEWWDVCRDPVALTLQDQTSMVMALDAGISHDAFAIQVVSRHPNDKTHVAQRIVRAWVPEAGKPLDFGDYENPDLETPRGFVRQVCQDFHVVQIAYDPHELHDFATQERKRDYAWWRPFPQGESRLLADRGLYDLVRDRRVHHLGDALTREHIDACAAKTPKDDDNRMRLVKKSAERRIDLAVALSMACHECLRLSL